MMKRPTSNIAFSLIRLFLLSLFTTWILTGCELPDDPQKNCNQPLKIVESAGPSELYFYYSHLAGSNNTVDEYWHTVSVNDICTDEFLLATCKLTTKRVETYDDIRSVKLFWIYEPWITRYKDYVYVIANPDNYTQWAGANLLLPYSMGFHPDYPATITFQVIIKLYDPLPQDEGLSWVMDNIIKVELEIEGTRF
jgi:hypothetical protein